MPCITNSEHHHEFDFNQREHSLFLYSSIDAWDQEDGQFESYEEKMMLISTTNCEHHTGIYLKRKEHYFPLLLYSTIDLNQDAVLL
mmetsp:Transcript_59550/g.66631  ORF Transcript_59550/g.66631 Transcript_59550/m.66631 type:complete len:86 (+) Transcript_59550:157-414(+)